MMDRLLRMLATVLSLAVLAAAVPMDLATLGPDSVGYTALEAELLSMAKVGKFELSFSIEDVREIVASIHPFHRYEESKENVVLMDEFPYVPVVEVPRYNASFVLSNLVLRENFDPSLTKVEFEPGWQSLFFVDIPLNATFDWRLNNTNVVGKANVRVPHSWVHQNLEAGCTRDQSSMLVWEGRVDVYPTNIDIITSYDKKEVMDAFAEEIHSGRIVSKYIANALQHQLASLIGSLHWKLQSRLRDLCLTCISARSNNSTFIVRLGGDPKCIAGVPHFLWDRLSDRAEPLATLQNTIKDRLISALVPVFASPLKAAEAERLMETMALPSTYAMGIDAANRTGDTNSSDVGLRAEIKQLRPKHDPREKYKKSALPAGFIQDQPTVPQWRQKLGQLYMSFMGRPQVTVSDGGNSPSKTQ